MLRFFKKRVSKHSRGKSEEKEISKPVGPVNFESEGSDGMFETTREEGWIGVDLDGTLAKYDRWRGMDHVGEPIEGMLLRVKEWLSQGYHVKIVTARASVPEGIPPVKRWLEQNGLPDLEVTCQKDFHMIELWDDRAVQVVRNTGSPVLSSRWGALPRAPLFGMERPSRGERSSQRPGSNAP